MDIRAPGKERIATDAGGQEVDRVSRCLLDAGDAVLDAGIVQVEGCCLISTHRIDFYLVRSVIVKDGIDDIDIAVGHEV